MPLLSDLLLLGQSQAWADSGATKYKSQQKVVADRSPSLYYDFGPLRDRLNDFLVEYSGSSGGGNGANVGGGGGRSRSRDKPPKLPPREHSAAAIYGPGKKHALVKDLGPQSLYVE